jgi:hypothetical protein
MAKYRQQGLNISTCIVRLKWRGSPAHPVALNFRSRKLRHVSESTAAFCPPKGFYSYNPLPNIFIWWLVSPMYLGI